MAQQVKDLALSLLWLWLPLWHRFNPWARNFCMPWARPKKKKKKEKNCCSLLEKGMLIEAAGRRHKNQK